VLHNILMKTLSVTAGRSKLGHWLKRAIAGEDIGIVVDGVVVALRPVGVISEDYALREYGVTQHKLAGAAARISKDISAARKREQVKLFTGSRIQLP
jgi:hypothetical protein